MNAFEQNIARLIGKKASPQEVHEVVSHDALRQRVHDLIYANERSELDKSLHTTRKRGDARSLQIQVEVLFEQDVPDIVTSIFPSHGMELVASWGDHHFDTMLDKCPNTYKEWAKANAFVVKALGKHLNGLSGDQKCLVLQGKGTTKAETSIRKMLPRNAALWTELSPEWVGTPHSPLRQTAIELGWCPSMLAEMFFKAAPKKGWTDIHPTPYSLLASWLVMKREEERLWMNGFSREDLDLPPAKVSRTKVTCDANANPYDVALANVLMASCDITMQYRFIAHRSMRPIGLHETQRLKKVVDMHLGLGVIGTLVESLCEGTLPLLDGKTDEEVDLSMLG